MGKTSKKLALNRITLTKNEKKLISTLIFILLLWAYFKFILEPQAEKIQYLELEKVQYTKLIEEENQILNRKDEVNKKWETLHREREKIVAKYFPTLDQAQILYLLNDLTLDERVDIIDLAFTRPYKDKINDIDVERMDINIPFKGSYDGIMDVLKHIRNSPRSLIIDGLSIDRENNDILRGSMNIKVYSLEGIVEETDNQVIYIDKVEGNDAETPFIPYEDYVEPINLELVDHIDEMEKEIINEELLYNNENLREEKREGKILYNFENKMYEFIPSNPMIQGRVVPSSIKKSGKSALRLEYNILALEDENRAYIDLSSNNIIVKVPPTSIGIWVYSYGYSPGTLGMRLKGQAGEEIDIEMVKGITWTGWFQVEADLPNDMNLYPLQIDKLFYEIPYEREDYGVLLLDNLQAFYIDDGNESNINNQFYIVKAGDSITEISKSIYGTPIYENEIMELNGIRPGDVLPQGKILVLKSH